MKVQEEGAQFGYFRRVRSKLRFVLRTHTRICLAQTVRDTPFINLSRPSHLPTVPGQNAPSRDGMTEAVLLSSTSLAAMGSIAPLSYFVHSRFYFKAQSLICFYQFDSWISVMSLGSTQHHDSQSTMYPNQTSFSSLLRCSGLRDPDRLPRTGAPLNHMMPLSCGRNAYYSAKLRISYSYVHY